MAGLLAMVTWGCYWTVSTLFFLNPGVSGYEVKNYTVQLRLYVDPKAVSKWTTATAQTEMGAMEHEIRSIFADVTDMYESLLPHTDIDFRFEVVNITFLNKNLFEPGRAGTKAIADFAKWIAPSYKTEPFDLAMLITGVPMIGGLGFGYIGRICTDTSLAVVPFTATFKDAIVWAHEIGHVLGAQHDYEQEPDGDCYADSGKIMSPIIRRQPNEHNFVFSPCSASYIRANLEKVTDEGRNCLLDGDRSVSVSQFGTFVSPDEICKRMFGRASFADPKPYKRHPEKICIELHCQAKPAWKYLYYQDFTRAPQGMKCGKNKVCVKGKCVEDPRGSPLVSDECPLGDQERTGYEKYWEEECSKIDVDDCRWYAQDCCLTCNTTNIIYNMTADDVCQSLDGAGSVLKRGGYNSYGDALCQELKCMKGLKGHFTFNSYDTPEGMACGKDKRCYKKKCVKNRHAPTHIQSDSCPFGDQDLKAIGYKGSCSDQHRCSSWKNWCCQTCQGST